MIADIIIQSLMNNKSFARKTLPHLKDEYFEDIEHKTLFNLIKKYVIDYKSLPTNNTIKLEMTKDEELSGSMFDSITELIDNIYQEKKEYDDIWLMDNCEEWCKNRALHNAIVQSVEIIEEGTGVNSIPDLVRQALQVEFESSIGIEFFDEKGIDARYKEYNKKDVKYSTGIQALDNIFAGGLEQKALTVLMSGTGMGKTSSMCGLTSNFLRDGQDVLYITLEMAEEKIAQRIDANFLNVDINDVPLLNKKKYQQQLQSIKQKTKGRLIIKEYPPANISVSKIRFLLDELKIKLGFVPKIIVLDYLNLLNSDRIKSDNMYQLIKSIAEELRGLAVEQKLSILTATQGNRATNDENNSDIDLTNVSESNGLAATADALIGIIMPADLREKNIQIWKILKNRFGGIVNHKIPLRINFARAGIYDSNDEQITISDNSMANGIKMRTEENRLKNKNKIIVESEDENEVNVESELESLLS